MMLLASGSNGITTLRLSAFMNAIRASMVLPSRLHSIQHFDCYLPRARSDCSFGSFVT